MGQDAFGNSDDRDIDELLGPGGLSDIEIMESPFVSG